MSSATISTTFGGLAGCARAAAAVVMSTAQAIPGANGQYLVRMAGHHTPTGVFHRRRLAIRIDARMPSMSSNVDR
jgi:hypothetical protein